MCNIGHLYISFVNMFIKLLEDASCESFSCCSVSFLHAISFHSLLWHQVWICRPISLFLVTTTSPNSCLFHFFKSSLNAFSMLFKTKLSCLWKWWPSHEPLLCETFHLQLQVTNMNEHFPFLCCNCGTDREVIPHWMLKEPLYATHKGAIIVNHL